jgi:hypothetical protein
VYPDSNADMEALYSVDTKSKGGKELNLEALKRAVDIVGNVNKFSDRKIPQSVCRERPEEISPPERCRFAIEASSYWGWVPCSEPWGCPSTFAFVRRSFSLVHS